MHETSLQYALYFTKNILNVPLHTNDRCIWTIHAQQSTVSRGTCSSTVWLLILQRQQLNLFLPNGLKETSHKRMKPGIAFSQTLKEVRSERLSMINSVALPTVVTGVPPRLARAAFSWEIRWSTFRRSAEGTYARFPSEAGAAGGEGRVWRAFASKVNRSRSRGGDLEREPRVHASEATERASRRRCVVASGNEEIWARMKG